MSEIYPDFTRLVSRQTKERLLNQRSCAFWFTGLSGSGKTTIATGVEALLNRAGYVTAVLDGDNVRSGINKNLGFSDQDRAENVRRVAEIARLFVENGLVVLCCFISPLEEQRNIVRGILGEKDLVEVFVNTPLEICEQRDVKGLYKKARAGLLPGFTGVSAPFEAPAQPGIEVHTAGHSVDETVNQVYRRVLERITL